MEDSSPICPRCGSPLAPGAPREWSGRSGGYEFVVRGETPSPCPGGCGPVEPDAMASLHMVLDFSRAISDRFPRRKGIFRKRCVCRDCRSDLVLGDPLHPFAFTLPISGGSSLDVSMKGPSLVCVSCGKQHVNFPEGKGLEEFGAPLLGFFGNSEGERPK